MWSFSKYLKETTSIFIVLLTISTLTYGQCPDANDEIEGPTKLCLDDKGVKFSIPNTDGTTYEWILPDGLQGNNSTTNEVLVDVLKEVAANGVMFVVMNKAGCPTDTIGQKMTTVRLPIVTLEEKASICVGETYTVKEATVKKHKDFSWEVVNGDIANLTNADGLTPTYTPTQADVGKTIDINLKATTKDPCNQVVTATLKLTITGSGNVEEKIEGPDRVCENTTHHYKIPEVAGATSYKWGIPCGHDWRSKQ